MFCLIFIGFYTKIIIETKFKFTEILSVMVISEKDYASF